MKDPFWLFTGILTLTAILGYTPWQLALLPFGIWGAIMFFCWFAKPDDEY